MNRESDRNTELDGDVGYTARSEYLAEAVASDYVSRRFSGRLGRYRYRREQDAINGLLRQVPPDAVRSVLDCPTGIGRWLPNLATLGPTRIVGVDVSPTMLRHAQTVRIPEAIATDFCEGVAENLPYKAGEFDLVFCHALLKHLPQEAQGEVIAEMGRVCSGYAIISTSILHGLPGLVRRYRSAKGAVAVSLQWFAEATQRSGFEIIDHRKAATPVGVEAAFLLRRQPS